MSDPIVAALARLHIVMTFLEVVVCRSIEKRGVHLYRLNSCLYAVYSYMSLDSSVSIVSRLRTERPRNGDSCSGEGRLCSLHSGSVPHRASHPVGHGGSFPVVKIVVWLTTHLSQMPRLRMRGSVCPRPHTSSWCGA